MRQFFVTFWGQLWDNLGPHGYFSQWLLAERTSVLSGACRFLCSLRYKYIFQNWTDNLQTCVWQSSDEGHCTNFFLSPRPCQCDAIWLIKYTHLKTLKPAVIALLQNYNIFSKYPFIHISHSILIEASGDEIEVGTTWDPWAPCVSDDDCPPGRQFYFLFCFVIRLKMSYSRQSHQRKCCSLSNCQIHLLTIAI